ncbi:nucleotidyltransferase family protein [Deferrisoma camini]|uniref:nucleotidyltransferase family protein n=1 Tax=Deferrisoma camini TaxID=1035120 RepID=UPI0009FB9791|nr:nucleotidyltransferase domain-containing protein [Deferrisoma camini]
MDQEQAVRVAQEFALRARRRLWFERAVLFGSYAQGRAHETSDVDVGLILERLDARVDYLNLLTDLYEIAGAVDPRIEPHLLVRSEDRSGFGAWVERTGIPLSTGP